MLKKVLAAGAIAVAGGVLFAGSPAMASDGVHTSGAGSVLSGNQAVLGLDLPINVCGNAISSLGQLHRLRCHREELDPSDRTLTGRHSVKTGWRPVGTPDVCSGRSTK